MSRAFGVRVSQLIDQHKLRPSRERGIEIELAHRHAAIRDLEKRNDFEPFEQRFGFSPPMRLDVADDDIDSLSLLAMRGFEHGKCFADTGRVSKEHFQPAASLASLLGLHAKQQFVGIGSVVGHVEVIVTRRREDAK